ncbi:ADP-ribosylglycohydrolase family protein [Hymenobacter sp. BT186]|uniref:ADP-ribosylglycohydrolase family protein n=1 Tax=Hymenobacter telluris TaxID=2816474 RepID=A0A939J8L1_9BACT|nr:ADP-ribosylglycohydrolase family protein [Hymenobacter telluris]MBO0357864.1 ADP-ribosylglycohydrolase family protein [Hymenobacter telluris]MBW3373891.1 ADP-ribosylglycohydrolase family protein [Hymenobacter norwichensis]
MSPLESQLRAALLGLAVGDALGVPVEFQSRAARKTDPVVHMRAYGTHNQPAGTWSDDASLTFCLAEAIADGFTLRKLAHKCCRWYYEKLWTPHGAVFDIGITTREALYKFYTNPEGSPLAGGTDEYSNGNGALMRILPLAFYKPDAPLSSRFLLISDVSAITHGHVRSAIACFLYLEIARHLLAGLTPAAAYSQLCQDAPTQLQQLHLPAAEIQQFDYLLTGRVADLPEQLIRSGGYVMHTLEASLWCLLRYSTYAETVLAAVNLGDDTDTTGAVTGGLAGIYYGEAAIPPEWLAVLARRPDIENLAARTAAVLA